MVFAMFTSCTRGCAQWFWILVQRMQFQKNGSAKGQHSLRMTRVCDPTAAPGKTQEQEWWFLLRMPMWSIGLCWFFSPAYLHTSQGSRYWISSSAGRLLPRARAGKLRERGKSPVAEASMVSMNVRRYFNSKAMTLQHQPRPGQNLRTSNINFGM